MKKVVKPFIALIAINAIIYLFCLGLNSCKKTEVVNSKSSVEASAFRQELFKTKAKVAKKPLMENLNDLNFSTESVNPNLLTFYVDFGSSASTITQSLLTQSITVEQIAELINDYNAKVEYTPDANNMSYPRQVDIAPLIGDLQPLLVASKNYLYSKGFSESELQTMIQEENAQELDLIPFAMLLTSIEHDQSLAKNSNNFSFFNAAYAQNNPDKWKNCALKAIGMDFFVSAGSEVNHSWGSEAMKKAFKAIATRMLGPWGVLVAVATYALCMNDLY